MSPRDAASAHELFGGGDPRVQSPRVLGQRDVHDLIGSPRCPFRSSVGGDLAKTVIDSPTDPRATFRRLVAVYGLKGEQAQPSIGSCRGPPAACDNDPVDRRAGPPAMLSALARTAALRPNACFSWPSPRVVVAGVIGAPAAGLLKAKNSVHRPVPQSARRAARQAGDRRRDRPGVLAAVPAPPGSLKWWPSPKPSGGCAGSRPSTCRLSVVPPRWCRRTAASRSWRRL